MKTFQNTRQADYISISHNIKLAKVWSQHENVSVHLIPSRFSHFKLSKVTNRVFLRHLCSLVSCFFNKASYIVTFSLLALLLHFDTIDRNTKHDSTFISDERFANLTTYSSWKWIRENSSGNKIRITPVYFLKLIT